MWGGDFGWHYGLMGFGGLLFWGLVIAAIVFALRGQRCCHHRYDQPGEKTALDILKARYARGEIDDDEFRRRRKELE